MRRRRYLAAAVAVISAGCSDIRLGGKFEKPSGTEPLTGSFTEPSEENRWNIEVDPSSTLSVSNDIYICSKAGLDRFSPDGTRHWHVETETRPSMVISGDSTLYHSIEPQAEGGLTARDVATGDDVWMYETYGRPLTASDSAVFVGEASDDLSTGGQPIFALAADSGDRRWEDTVGTHRGAVLTTELCLIPHWEGTLSAFDRITGERRWEYSHDGGNDSLQVAGNIAYQLTEDSAAAYGLPGGEKHWDRSLNPTPNTMGTATPDPARTDILVIGSREGTLHGLDAEIGDTDWALELPGTDPIFHIPRWERTVAVVSDGILYGFDVASGDERWRQDLRPVADARPRAVINGTLFLATVSEDDQRQFRTFDMESGQRQWKLGVGGERPEFGVAGNRFIILTAAGEMYGFGTD